MVKNSKPVKDYTKEELALVAVQLAADLGWTHVTLRDVAREAGLPLADVVRDFEDKGDIVCVYGRYIDRRTLEEAGTLDMDLSARERLFDILMERFDVLSEHRDGVVSILKSFKTDPKQLVMSLPYLARSMNLMLEGAGIDTNGVKGALRVAGLKVIYLSVLRAWMEDDSPDMGKTMAELDKRLGQVEGFAERLGL